MIRTKEFAASPELKKAWKNAIAPAAKAALVDFRTWPLYEHIGEPWPDAPARFARVTLLNAVVKGHWSSASEALQKAANPGLKAMYQNLSMLLNVRQQYFQEAWSSVTVVVWRSTEKALADLTKRLKWKPKDSEKGFWQYGPNTHHWQSAWEQLHPQTIEAQFQEHFVAIYRAGHVPAGLQGKDWKTCKFLYY